MFSQEKAPMQPFELQADKGVFSIEPYVYLREQLHLKIKVWLYRDYGYDRQYLKSK